ncbi:MAG: SRPBCC family protein [Solirubrobacteraceae bacterium]
MRVVASTHISAPRERVWDAVTDPARVLSFMSGVTRWEVEGEQRTGLGARYRVLFRIGAAEVGGLIEIVEWDEGRELAWTSVMGIDQRGRWRLREGSGGRTRVELRMAYGVAGAGLTGWLAERVAAPTVSAHLRRSVRALKRLVEHEQLRERAAARKAARAA